MTYILDACALLALLNEEFGKGYETVRDLLENAAKGEAVLCMSLINLVEVYYRYIQLKGVTLADTIMEQVKTSLLNLSAILAMKSILKQPITRRVIPCLSLTLFSAPRQKASLPLLLPRTKKLKLPKETGICLYSGYNCMTIPFPRCGNFIFFILHCSFLIRQNSEH